MQLWIRGDDCLIIDVSWALKWDFAVMKSWSFGSNGLDSMNRSHFLLLKHILTQSHISWKHHWIIKLLSTFHTAFNLVVSGIYSLPQRQWRNTDVYNPYIKPICIPGKLKRQKACTYFLGYIARWALEWDMWHSYTGNPTYVIQQIRPDEVMHFTNSKRLLIRYQHDAGRDAIQCI